MPELLLFAACEKLIQDEEGNQSLIAILQTINIEIPRDVEIPANTLTPKEWDIVTLWRPIEGEEGEFIQIVEINHPGGGNAMRSELSFGMPTGHNYLHRNKVHVVGMPVSIEGQVSVNLRVHRRGEQPSENPMAVWPLFIVHRRVEAAINEARRA
jgi:hypothetical protein